MDAQYYYYMKEKYSYISSNKEQSFINESKVYRKKWKARMFLENGSYFDDIRLNSSNCFELKGNFSAYDDRINEETFNIKNNSLVIPRTEDAADAYILNLLRNIENDNEYNYQFGDMKLIEEILFYPSNVKIYISALHLAIENGYADPWEGLVSKFFYEQHEWDLFLIINKLLEICFHGVSAYSDGPRPLYWFKSKELIYEFLKKYPWFIENRPSRSLPLKWWSEQNFLKEIVDLNYCLFNSAPWSFKQSKQKVIEAASIDGRIIKFVGRILRNDIDIAKVAVKSSPDSIKFLSKKTKSSLNL